MSIQILNLVRCHNQNDAHLGMVNLDDSTSSETKGKNPRLLVVPAFYLQLLGQKV